jgi:hypothetical protein
MKKMMEKIVLKTACDFFIVCCFFCFLWLSLLPAAMGAKPEENEILAIGTATVKDGNLAQAKESAISDALTKGVENYILHRLGSEGVANNFQRIIYDILPRAKAKVENFNILSVDQTGQEYKVLIRLRVNEKVIDEELSQAGVMVTEGPPIKVLFLVSEWKGGTAYYWWRDPETYSSMSGTELVLHNVFQERGLSPINRTLKVPDTGYSESLKHVDLKDVDALEWGRLFSADVVIYGQIEIIDKKEVSMALQTRDVNQGAQISQTVAFEQIKKGTKGKQPVMEATERLANQLAAKLTPAIIRYTASDRGRVRHLDITLKGLRSYKQFRAFRDFLGRDVSGVKSVRQTRVRKDSISIAVEFQGDRKRFLERVLNHENLPFLVKLDQGEEEIVFRIE